MDTDEILELKLSELKEKLTSLGLHTTGRKVVLHDRIFEHFGIEDIDNDDDNNDIEVASLIRFATGEVREVARTPFTQDSFYTFSGQPMIEKWLEIFQKNAEVVQLNSLQKFIYGKQLLVDAAKMFVRSQCGIYGWESLRKSLQDEFGPTQPATEVHIRLLCNMRKRQGEDHKVYLYCLMKLGDQVSLDDVSFTEYSIEGLLDSKPNMANLYQAKSLRELKEQITVYEKIRVGFKSVTTNNSYSTSSSEVQRKPSEKYCFQCGDVGILRLNVKRQSKI